MEYAGDLCYENFFIKIGETTGEKLIETTYVIPEGVSKVLTVISLIDLARLTDYCSWAKDLKNMRYSDEAKVDVYQAIPLQDRAGFTGLIVVAKGPPPKATHKTTISGYVRNILNQPLPDVELNLLPIGMRTFTDESGYYEFSDIPLPPDLTKDPYTLKSTELTITARKVTYYEANRKLEVYSDVKQKVDIVLNKNNSERGTLKGLVLDASTGQPVVSSGPCFVNIYRSESQNFPYFYFSYDGNYTTTLEPGNYYVTVSALGYNSAEVRNLIVKVNEITDAPTIYMQPLNSKVPIARFTVSAGDGIAKANQTLNLTVLPGEKTTVNFSATESYDEDGFISTYKWTINGIEVNRNKDFTYDLSKGTYKIALTIIDNMGLESRVESSINVVEVLNVPTVKTETPLNITQNSVTIRGIVTPNGADTFAWFEWGTTVPYDNSTTPQGLSSGFSSEVFSKDLSGLTCGKKYYYRAVAQNGGGRISGGDLSFTTLACSFSTPVISNVSPNPVTGSNSQQTVTLTGNGFVSGLAVMVGWTGGSKVLTISQVSVDSSTQVRIFITTTTTADTWWVKVTSPDGQSSNTANFTVVAPASTTFNLTVKKAGTGSGTVTSNLSGINCGIDCLESYNSGTAVTLTATPDTNSTFVGWSGNSDCLDGILTMNADKICTANFNLQTYNLSIKKSGTGSGTVTSNLSDINCGTTCQAFFTNGSSVILTATSASGSIFAGWSGDTDCSDGSVTITSDKTCTATFNLASVIQAPLPPTNSKAVGSSNTVLLQWTDNSNNEDGFKIERKIGTSGTYTPIKTVNANITTFQDTGLTFGTIYCYQIRAYNTGGDSSPSNPEVCATTLDTPTLSSPLDGTTITTSSVTLQWNNITGAEGYRVDVGINCGDTSILNDKASASYSITVSNLTNGAYYWRVRAFNGTYPGLSADSGCRSFTVSVPTERIINGSFDLGQASGWTKWGDFWIGNSGISPFDKYRTSPGYAAGGVDTNGQAKSPSSGGMYQYVPIPPNATSATLSFYYNISSFENTSTANDYLLVTVVDSSGNSQIVALLSNKDVGTLGVYKQITPFDVTSYKGQTIKIDFLSSTNATLNTIFRIDDVSLMADDN